MSKKPLSILLPHEHGAWAMFLVPLVIGLALGFRHSALNNSTHTGIVVLVFLITAFGFFLVRYPLMLLVKTQNPKGERNWVLWIGVYGAMALLGGVTLLSITQIWSLVFIGLIGGGVLGVHLWLAMRRLEMSVLGEWTAIAGATLAAPGGYVFFAGAWNITAVMLYALNLLYFGGTVYYIKFKVREQPRMTTPASNWRARLLAARAPILYTIIALIIVGILAMLGWLSAFAILAMLIPLPKVLIGALERPTRVNLPRLGVIEIAHSLAFMLLMMWAFS